MTEPIDQDLNGRSNLLTSLQILMQIKDKVEPVTDLAFSAVDINGDGGLDSGELGDVMRTVAALMNVTSPTKDDIASIMKELDKDGDKTVSKEEIYQLIILVLGKMLESEQEIDDRKNNVKISGLNNVKSLLEVGMANSITKASLAKQQ